VSIAAKSIPELKRAVQELAALHRADIVLVEDKASGSSLIQELRAEHFSLVQEAPAIDGDKVMRLRAQTAKIAGGFVLFPTEAHWLDTYLTELVTFPNSKYDDQVDSTVFALAWSTLKPSWPGWTDEAVGIRSVPWLSVVTNSPVPSGNHIRA
jgi:predicted phage terminase large subunit-like protein